MSAYRKFSDTLQNEARAPSPPKAAKAPKVGAMERAQPVALGGLDALDGLPVEMRIPAPGLAGWAEAEEERAAIVEHDGKVPRAWAEGFARLDPDRPPGDVPLRRWQRFIDDVGLFLDSPFCAVAMALGWGPHDLFGCDRDRPFARIDQAGLLWLLEGDRVIMLSEDAASMETRTGTPQTYRRRPREAGRVLAWELAP